MWLRSAGRTGSEPSAACCATANNRSGFEELDHWLQSQGTVERVVMESSGHYWLPLASHLRQRGVPVAVVNPLEAKYFAKSRLRRTKSDPADARTLAELGVRDQPPAREPLVGVEVREAARFCIRLVEDQARVCQRIRRLVEIGFPELGELFEDPTCETALAVLRQAPTARSAVRRRLDTLATRYGREAAGGRGRPRPRALQSWPGRRGRRPDSMPRAASRCHRRLSSSTSRAG